MGRCMKKNALIFGAAGAIGSAVLKTLDKNKWKTIAVSRETSLIQDYADYVFDISFTDVSQIAQTAYLISQKVEGIDLWVYAAGDILSAKISDMRPEEWDRILMANLSGAFYTLHFSLPLLSEGAHIFLIGAVSERLRLPGLSAYAAAKSGLEAFAGVLRKEQRKKLVTVVRPGAVKTTFWDKVPMKIPPDAASPEKVALKIIAAYQAGHQGNLDLV